MVVPSYNDNKKIYDAFTLLDQHVVTIIGEDKQCPYLFGSIQNNDMILSQPILHQTVADDSCDTVIDVGKTVQIEVVKGKDTHTMVGMIPKTPYYVQIYCTDIYDESEIIRSPNLPRTDFKTKSLHDCKIIQIIERNKSDVSDSMKLEIYGSIKPSVLKSSLLPPILSKEDLQKNSTYVGYVFFSHPDNSFTVITLSRLCKGKVLQSDIKGGVILKKGEKVKCKVKLVDEEIIFSHVELFNQ